MKNNINVLVVDDESRVHRVLENMLITCGYNVTSVNNTQAALESIGTNKTDLIIADIRMPDRSGFELLKEIKRRYPNIIVIMMTGFNDTNSIRESFRLGADEYITKPFKTQELSLIIERVCWHFFHNNEELKTIPARDFKKEPVS